MTAAFASYAAVAIENTRLYQSAQEQAAISTVMLQVAEAARLLDTLDEVLETVANLVPLLVGVDRCALLLWDRNEEVFRPAAAYGLTPMQQDTFDQWVVAPGDEPIFEELRRGASVHLRRGHRLPSGGSGDLGAGVRVAPNAAASGAG
jgi:hypothetical protein